MLCAAKKYKIAGLNEVSHCLQVVQVEVKSPISGEIVIEDQLLPISATAGAQGPGGYDG